MRIAQAGLLFIRKAQAGQRLIGDLNDGEALAWLIVGIPIGPYEQAWKSSEYRRVKP